MRELRFTAAEIAETLGMAHSTASAVLKRHGMGRLPRPDADEPERRYERARPGELVHVDVKKLGKIAGVGHRITGQRRTGGGHQRGPGWEFVHVCVDDCTRLAYVEVLESERTDAVCAFLQRAVEWFAGHGIEVERVMTDNGPGYRSHAHAALCRQLGLRHLFTEPYRPRTQPLTLARLPTTRPPPRTAPASAGGCRQRMRFFARGATSRDACNAQTPSRPRCRPPHHRDDRRHGAVSAHDDAATRTKHCESRSATKTSGES